VALWQFKTMRPELTHHLQTMLESKKEEILELGIETVGQIKEYAFRKTLKSMLRANHSEKIRKSILLALIHLEDENAIPHLLDHFFHHPIKFYDVSNRFKRIVQSALELHIIDKINGLLCKHHHLSLKEMSKETLELLSSLYTKVNAHREVHQIKKVLDSRERGSL